MTDQLFTVELTQEERRVLIVALDSYFRENRPAFIDHDGDRRRAWEDRVHMETARHKLTQATPTGRQGTV